MLTVLVVLMGKMMLDEINKTLDDDVITLHNIARKIEQTIGNGQLSEDVRNVANRLSEILKKTVI